MASNLEFVQYVAEQLKDAGDITYGKMFGEYGLYCDGKIFGLICNDQLFVKITQAGKRVYPELQEAPPYKGAKNYLLVEDVDDGERLVEFVAETCRELPPPKPNKSRKSKDIVKANENEIRKTKLDYKKEYKDLYLPKMKPVIIRVPEMTFLMVDGKGNPNNSEEYRNALEALYGLSYTIKMSKRNETQPQGFYDYVVFPLEGLWTTEDVESDEYIHITDKSKFRWTSMIRQPEFVTQAVFQQAKEALRKKKPNLDTSAVRLEKFTEGLCCQIMHLGSYDDEPATVERLERFVTDSGYALDFSDVRRHHEIYLNDPRKTAPEKLKTVIRHPIISY